MTNARDIMSQNAECIGENQTVEEAARKMRDLDVAALPVCGEDNRLAGMITVRDIVVKCIAQGGDPASTTAGSLCEGRIVTISADDPIEEVLRTMGQHNVRRLPVIDGHDLVGVVTQADVAKQVPKDKVSDLLETMTN